MAEDDNKPSSEPKASESGIKIEHGDKVNIILDMSMWDLFELCKCRYNYRHNKNRSVPIDQKSEALDRGSVAHEGLQIYFEGIKAGTHYDDRMHATIMRMQQFASDPEQCNLEPDEVNTVMQAVEESCDYWRFEDEQLEILEVERAFAYVLYEDDFVRIIISGKIDVLVNLPGIGRNASYTNLPIDHKTYSRDSDLLELSNQFMNYCVATNSKYLYANRIGLQKKLAPHEKFKRQPLSYTPEQLEMWKQNTANGILHEYLDCVARQEWRMNFTSCLKFNRKCEYYEICKSSSEEEKQRKLEEGFVLASPWDVTARFNKG